VLFANLQMNVHNKANKGIRRQECNKKKLAMITLFAIST